MTQAMKEFLVDSFDYEKTQKVMKVLEWKYWDTVGDVPTIEELKATVMHLLNQCENPSTASKNWSTGGFTVKYVETLNKYRIEFVAVSKYQETFQDH